MPAVCAVDVGTTRIKALTVSEEGTPGPVAGAPSELETPRPGAAEVDADALWRRTLGVLRQAAATAGQVAALAITNQRATVFVVDGAGTPLARGLSWHDRRGEQALSAWLERVGAAHFAQVTGLVPSALWSLSRILWWQQRGLPPGARFATVQDWLLRRLGASEWVLDPANASAVGLLNVHSLTWDDALLQATGVARAQLPALAASGTPVGRLARGVAAATGLPAGTPLILGGGDQQCASLGAGVVDPGMVAANLGTAGVISAPCERPLIDRRGRLVCLAHVVPGRWVLEGLETSYGGGLTWGGDLLGEDPVAVAPEAEASLFGTALLAWLGLGHWPDLHAAAAALPPPARVVSPHPERRRLYHPVYERYQAALAGLRQARLLSFPAEARHG